MNRSILSALGLAGALALVASPAAAQHRRDGEERGNGASKEQHKEQPKEQHKEQHQEQRQERHESRQPETRQAPQAQSTQPAVPPAVPRSEERAVPRQGSERTVPQQQTERAVPRQGSERAVPQQGVERAIPRQDYRPPQADDRTRGDNRNDNWRSDNRRDGDNRRYDGNGRYGNRQYGYAAPRYAAPRYYSGRYYGPRYVGPRFTVAPRRFYRPYYVFRPRVSIGFGIFVGYPVAYYQPYYYPYDYYPYASTPGYVVPTPQSNMGGLSFAITPDTAEVWVDDNYFGTVGQFTPDAQPLGLPAGRHYVELREPGFQVSSFDVDIIAGQVIPYQGQLEP
jgi:hypothetical protein